MIGLRLTLLSLGLVLIACAPSYQVTEELDRVIVPGVCRIGEIEYDPGVEPIGPEPLPREPIHLLRQQLEFALEGTDLFTEVTLYEDSEQYVVRGVIREFSDQSGSLNFPGLNRTGTVLLTVHLELVDSSGTVLFAGDFSRRVTSRFGVNARIFERIAHDFAGAIEDEVRSGKAASDIAEE